MQSPPRSPLAGGRLPGSSSFKQLGAQLSPISERFRRAAVDSDIVVAPGSRIMLRLDDADCNAPQAGARDGFAAVLDEEIGVQASFAASEPAAEDSLQPGVSHYSVDADLAGEPAGVSVSSSVREDRRFAEQQQQEAQPGPGAASPPRHARKQESVHSTAGGSRPSSAQGSRPGSTHGSRPGSANGTATSSSRRNSAHDPALRRQASQTAMGGPATPGYAASTRSSAARGVVAVAGAGPSSATSKAACPLPCVGRAKAGAAAKAQATGNDICMRHRCGDSGHAHIQHGTNTTLARCRSGLLQRLLIS